jgi:hypothetical protein
LRSDPRGDLDAIYATVLERLDAIRDAWVEEDQSH